ncbi:hypothetical protein CYMTET_56524 [Cymbomonas tetramitiformis]|uniref:Bestrophin homolog n=1 Tax=Cymbomonas tetramitiformis TaxID=36881 RepID=A0AAE0BB43_9CHLO|nr:hypothetical protein CYMTET_56524 [Cymbomonas tetramitiformis]
MQIRMVQQLNGKSKVKVKDHATFAATGGQERQHLGPESPRQRKNMLRKYEINGGKDTIMKRLLNAVYAGKGYAGIASNAFMVYVGLHIGLGAYEELSSHSPNEIDHFNSTLDQWEDIPGWGTGVHIIGSGLSFLLVFRVNWSFTRWWEARGLVGQMTTILREFCITTTPFDHDSRSEDDMTPEKIKCRKFMHSACKAWFGNLVDILSDSEDMKTLMPEFYTALQVAGLGHDRVILSQCWLGYCLREAHVLGLVAPQEYQILLAEKRELLSNAYACLKIRNTPVPSLMSWLTLLLLCSYIIILPKYLAYAFVMKMSSTALEEDFVNTPAIKLSYTIVTLVSIFFLCALRQISLQMDNPFGQDMYDLPLAKYRDSLWTEVDSIVENVDKLVNHLSLESGAFKHDAVYLGLFAMKQWQRQSKNNVQDRNPHENLQDDQQARTTARDDLDRFDRPRLHPLQPES